MMGHGTGDLELYPYSEDMDGSGVTIRGRAGGLWVGKGC